MKKTIFITTLLIASFGTPIIAQQRNNNNPPPATSFSVTTPNWEPTSGEEAVVSLRLSEDNQNDKIKNSCDSTCKSAQMNLAPPRPSNPSTQTQIIKR